MEITTWQIYWITRLDAVLMFFAFLFVICVCIGITALILYPEYPNESKRFVKLSIPAMILSLLLFVFIPSSKQMAAIIIIPRIINNEKIQVFPNQIMDLASEWLQELKPNKK